MEKYVSAAIIVLRVGREMSEPVAAMQKDLRDLSDAVKDDYGAAVLVADLDRNLREIERSFRRLSEIRDPQEWKV